MDIESDRATEQRLLDFFDGVGAVLGTPQRLSARFAFVRVVAAAADGREPRLRDRVWLVCEWRDDDDAPYHFHLATYRR